VTSYQASRSDCGACALKPKCCPNIRKINQATGVAPFDLVRVADLGDAWLERPFELQGALAEITAFFTTVYAAGVTPLSVGGDHSISLPILRAIARDGPLGRAHGRGCRAGRTSRSRNPRAQLRGWWRCLTP
jgi:hypothetical protein